MINLLLDGASVLIRRHIFIRCTVGVGGTVDNKSRELDIFSLLVPVSPAAASLGGTQRGRGDASEAVISRAWLRDHHPAPVAVHPQVEGGAGVPQQPPAQVLLPRGSVLPHHLGVAQV